MKPEKFQYTVRTQKRPLVVELWATWCGPCKVTRPILHKLAEEYKGKVDFLEVDADESQAVLKDLHVMAIPTLLVYKNGQEMLRQTGAKSPEAYRKLFEQLAKDEAPTVFPLSAFDRILRSVAGLTFVGLALYLTNYWLLPIGGILLFSAVYDRCPIWRAVTGYFKKART
jgi:thioredoxin 1